MKSREMLFSPKGPIKKGMQTNHLQSGCQCSETNRISFLDTLDLKKLPYLKHYRFANSYEHQGSCNWPIAHALWIKHSPVNSDTILF